MSQILRHVPPVPPNFGEAFVRGGWREIEEHYGARTDLLLKWIEMSGGESLYERRRQHMREHGIRPFGRHGGNRAVSTAVKAQTCPAR